MKTRIKNILFTLVIITGLAGLSLAAVPTPAVAQFKDEVCKGVGLTGGGTGCGPTDPNDPNSAQGAVGRIITTAINVISLVVGVIAVIMIIIGGIKYITSGGDSGNISAAKNTVLYAIIGLVIVAMAQVIVRFVLTRF